MIKEARDAARLGKPSIQRRNRARSSLGLDEDQRVIVTIGRQDFQKGQRYVLEAMAMLVSKHPNLVLLVAGRSGDVSGELESLRHRLGLQNRVHFLGHR
ncbi:MAG: glycosyltransferase, partial [Nitrospira sp.]|nr:glycosyltransferase [Nitrospira sp.]